jgi:predicted enzyme related to lactoylglutathione lyase
MSNADIRGRFIWHELMTTDPEAAGAFYSKVVPWKTQPSGMPSYTLWLAGNTQTGGLMALPEDSQAAGTPPHWLIYLGTPDVDATVSQAEGLGAKVLKPAADIPNVGRFAVLADPQGATFAVYTPGTSVEGGGSGGAPEPGEYMWHELATTDPEGALAFYTELFGWSKGEAHDMGNMTYQIFDYANPTGMGVGGIYRVQGASTPSHWLSYVRVSNVEKAVAAAKANGGRVLNGPMEVPGGSWIAMLLDPQGGEFALVEPPKSAAAAKAKPEKAKAEKAKAEKAKAEKGRKASPVKTAAAEQPKPAATSEPAETTEADDAEEADETVTPAAPERARKAPRKAAGKKAAAKKAPAKSGRGKTAGKKAAKTAKTAARGGQGRAAKSAAKKRPAAKRPAAKRAAPGRSSGTKRGKGAAGKPGKAAKGKAKAKGRR